MDGRRRLRTGGFEDADDSEFAVVLANVHKSIRYEVWVDEKEKEVAVMLRR